MYDFVIRNDDVVLREEDDDGALLFNPDANRLFVLNTTGLFLWRMLDGTHTLAHLCQALEAEFSNTAHDTLEDEVGTFLDDLKRADFARVPVR